ncbi:lysophospholipid acyltransferase family protein [Dongia sp. agr-C8]
MLGLNVRNLKNLPLQGPAIVVANHNSHLDTFVLMTLFPLSRLHRLRPVAAADYFLRNRAIAWFTLNIINMIPLDRSRVGKRGEDPLENCAKALEAGEILLVYPEGTRGETEALAKFKGGVARLKEQYPEVPVVPVYMQGLSRALPKGEFTLVPVVVDVFVGEPVAWTGSRPAFTQALQDSVAALAAAAPHPTWK